MRRSLMWCLVSVLALCLQACGDDAAEVTKPGSTQETTLSDCAALIPAAVVEGLGWSASGSPSLDSGTCTLVVTEGTLTVQRRAVPATGPDDLPAAAEKAYDERCATLDQGQPGEPVDWLGPDTPGCAVTSPDGSGVSILLSRAAEDLVVELRVSPDVATTPEKVQQALVELEQAAADHL